MNNNIDISVIIPAFNMEHTLEAGVDTILKQSFTNFEIIIVNDGSKDGTLEIAKNLEKKDIRIKVYDKLNEGAGPTRNFGILKSRGNYIYFFDGDDELVEDAFETLYDEVSKGNYDIVIGGYKIKGKDIYHSLNENHYAIDEYSSKELFSILNKNGLSNSPWNKIYRSDLIKNNNIQFPDIRRGQDAIFNLAYFSFVKRCAYINKIIYIYKEITYIDSLNKFPSNYFDITTYLWNQFLFNYKNWNIASDENIDFINFTYIKEIRKCFIYSYSKKWKMNCKERSAYIYKICNNNEVKKITKNIVVNNKLDELFILLLKFKSINLIKLYIRFYKTILYIKYML